MLKRPLYNTIIFFLCILLAPYLIITHNHLGEDCFISFRYVENFVSGHGLVYNTGERVEGYSDYLWVMMLSLFRWMGFSPILVSKFLGLVSTILLVWVGSYYSLKKLQRKIDWIYLATPLLLFFNPYCIIMPGAGWRPLFTPFYSSGRRSVSSGAITPIHRSPLPPWLYCVQRDSSISGSLFPCCFWISHTAGRRNFHIHCPGCASDSLRRI